MGSFSNSGKKAEFTRTIAGKVGVSEELLGLFARRAKKKFQHPSGRHNGIATIKKHLRNNDVAGAKAALTARVATKFNTTPERLGEFVRAIKAKRGRSESMQRFKAQVRGYFSDART